MMGDPSGNLPLGKPEPQSTLRLGPSGECQAQRCHWCEGSGLLHWEHNTVKCGDCSTLPRITTKPVRPSRPDVWPESVWLEMEAIREGKIP